MKDWSSGITALSPRTLAVFAATATLAGSLISCATPEAEASGGSTSNHELADSSSTTGSAAPSFSRDSGPVQPLADQTEPRYNLDPSAWSNQSLAAQVLFTGVEIPKLSKACASAKLGVGGFVLFGATTSRLKSDLATINNCARQAAPNAVVKPWIASDEEGGRVQRLTRLLGRLPSAASIGKTMDSAQIQRLANNYGRKMRELGVTFDLAPVADLAYRGSYIAGDGRSFGADPSQVSNDVVSWANGMKTAGIASAAKHWPGHGSARNSHTGAAKTEPWSWISTHDILPFRAAASAGITSVMVGHLTVPGLSDGMPASQSLKAITQLRSEIQSKTLIITDSLAMDAVTGTLRQSQQRAVIRALAAGADLAMINGIGPRPAINAIVSALRSGELKREQLVTSARRILAAKAELWLTL